MTEDTNNIKNTPQRRFIIIGVFVFTLIAIVILFSDYGLLNRFKLTMEIRNLKQQIEQQNKIKDSLLILINKLEKDSIEIEKVAREKYGMIKRNEEVYYILDTNKIKE
jgi:cell division protein FtsB